MESCSSDRRNRTIALVKNVWIHGFLGRGERTFKELPSYVHDHLQRSYEGRIVLDRVLYDYKSKGKYGDTRDNIVSWIKIQVQSWSMEANGAEILVILYGHSMGGLLAADVVRHWNERKMQALYKCRILGLVAYDTPFFSLDKKMAIKVVKDASMRPLQMLANITVERASVPRFLKDVLKKVSSSLAESDSFLSSLLEFSASMAAATFLLLVAKLFRVQIAYNTMQYLEFTKQLANFWSHHERVEDVLKILKDTKFCCFYNELPSRDESGTIARKFIRIPSSMKGSSFFRPLRWDKAPSEDANQYHAEAILISHMLMFDPQRNPHYDKLKRRTVNFILQIIDEYYATRRTEYRHRHPPPPPPPPPPLRTYAEYSYQPPAALYRKKRSNRPPQRQATAANLPFPLS